MPMETGTARSPSTTALRIDPNFAAIRECLEQVLRWEINLHSALIGNNVLCSAIRTMPRPTTSLAMP